MSENRRGEIFAAIAALIFGTSYVAASFALRSFSPLGVAFWRGAIAAAILLGLAALGPVDRQRFRTDRTQLPRLAALGFLGGPGFIIAMNVAVASTGATIAAFVAGLYAVLAAVLAPFVLHERLGRPTLVGFVVALAGTALLARLDPASTTTGGVAAALAGAGSFALYLVLLRRWTRDAAGSGRARLASESIALSVFVMTAAVTLVLEIAREPGSILPSSIGLDAAVATIWLGLGPGCLAQLLVAASARRIPSRRSAAFLLLNPVTAAVIAAVLLGETLAPIQLAGGLLVLLGMALATGMLRRRNGSPADAPSQADNPAAGPPAG